MNADRSWNSFIGVVPKNRGWSPTKWGGPLGGALWARPTPWSGSRHAGFSCSTGGPTRPYGVPLRLSAAKYLPAIGAAVLLLGFWWFSPPPEPAFRLCPFYWLTARPCPLCGLTRAFCALAKGHWSQAIHFHALSPLAFAMLFSLFAKGRWRALLWTGGLAAIALYGVWRAAVR